MPHLMIVLIPYINILNLFLENNMSIFEEYGAFKARNMTSHNMSQFPSAANPRNIGTAYLERMDLLRFDDNSKKKKKNSP